MLLRGYAVTLNDLLCSPSQGQIISLSFNICSELGPSSRPTLRKLHGKHAEQYHGTSLILTASGTVSSGYYYSCQSVTSVSFFSSKISLKRKDCVPYSVVVGNLCCVRTV